MLVTKARLPSGDLSVFELVKSTIFRSFASHLPPNLGDFLLCEPNLPKVDGSLAIIGRIVVNDESISQRLTATN